MQSFAEGAIDAEGQSEIDAEAEAELNTEEDLGPLPTRSMISTSSAAAMEAHVAAQHAAQFKAQVDEKVQEITSQYAHDLKKFASAPKTHQKEFDQFTRVLQQQYSDDKERIANSLTYKPAPTPEANPTPLTSESVDEQVAAARVEMDGEPVTMFLEVDEELEGTRRNRTLVLPKIVKGTIGLPEAPEPPKVKKDLTPCPKKHKHKKHHSLLEVESEEEMEMDDSLDAEVEEEIQSGETEELSEAETEEIMAQLDAEMDEDLAEFAALAEMEGEISDSSSSPELVIPTIL